MGISTKRLLRQLRALEKTRGRKVVYGGGKRRMPYYMDRKYLANINSRQGRATNDRLDALEKAVKELRAEIAYIRSNCQQLP